MRLPIVLSLFSPVFAALINIDVGLNLPGLLGPGPGRCSKGRTSKNQACCVWFDVLDDLQEKLFDHGSCTFLTSTAQLTFHDAIAYSHTLGGNGADGSIMQHSDIETTYVANHGLVNIIGLQRAIAISHKVSFGDFIQFAGAVGLSNCPGAPKLEFLAGRPNSSTPAPDNLVPGPADSVTKIIERFADAGFNSDEMVDLLASHSVAAQHGIDPSIPGAPLDSTPGTFDSQFYIETLLAGTSFPGSTNSSAEALSPIRGEFRFQSDWAIARDPRTACEWQSFISEPSKLGEKFYTAMSKLATTGNTRSKLTDCSDVIPTPRFIQNAPYLPPGKHRSDIQASCKNQPFPNNIQTARGPVVSIAPVPS
ncbi:versatile peroxidase VPS1 [Mycena pura]|uniref:Peroxidase n=1 Tax=Mycena pura TaxID=153505 RepID=A0AAD6XX83_9AGAR|nr:versatile peroxidase VPS1 [Mycena pura]